MGINYFKGIGSIGKVQLNEQLDTNIRAYIDWGFLTIGGYFNVNMPQSGVYGGDQSRLRPANDPNYSNGQVWETFRSNLVWESGINSQYAGAIPPIQISGVYVNNIFYPTATTTGAFSHHINYPEGRVIFKNSIATTSIVKLNYSYKFVNIKSVDSELFRELMFNSFRVDKNYFLNPSSGNWSQLPVSRVQLPAVFVEILDKREYEGYQLGGGQRVRQTVFFHVFAENAWTRGVIVDSLANQNRTTLYLFDKNLMIAQNAFPLTASGTLTANPKTYPQLIQPSGNGGFWYEKAYILNSQVKKVDSVLPLYRGQVRWEIELDLIDL